jgi:hypothetical protein
MFQLDEKEIDSLVSQNAIPSKKHLGGSLPFAFTEHGVLMPLAPGWCSAVSEKEILRYPR